LVVIPSRHETFPLVALEAMAYSKPLVSFSIDGLSWIPNGCILQAPSFDTKILAKQIARILKDSSLRKRMSAKSLAEVSNFTWDKSAKQYHAAVTEVTQVSKIAYD